MNRRIAARLALLALLLLPACLPIPDLRLDLELDPVEYRLPPERVRVQGVDVEGFAEPNTPDEHNRAMYLRYYTPRDDADTVLVLVPGLFGGATSFDVLARQLVAATPGLEVWAVDRRSGTLEDRDVFLEALRTGDVTRAHEYYVLNYGRPDGFQPRPSSELRFMAHWGVETHLRDLHVIVSRAREHAPRVVLGGHSLGASIASYYAAFDFGAPGEPTPGDDFIDGLVLIEGTLGRTGGYERDSGLFSLGPIRILPAIAELEAGLGEVYITVARGPQFFAPAQVAALLARVAPDELSPGGFVPFPATNRAVVGILGADRYADSTVFSFSLGEATNATYAGNLLAFALSGREGTSSRRVVGVAPGADAVGWERGSPARYRTDVDALARAWSNEYADFGEWYFPTRLPLDASELGVRLRDQPGFVPNADVTVPTLAVGASRGLVTSLDGFSAYMNVRAQGQFSAYILPGLTHLDIVAAEDNPLVPLMNLWLSGRRPTVAD